MELGIILIIHVVAKCYGIDIKVVIPNIFLDAKKLLETLETRALGAKREDN